MKKLHPIYEDARADLERRLDGLRKKGMDQSFSAHHLRIALVQVNDALKGFSVGMNKHLQSTGRVAGALGQRHLVTAVKKLETTFTGHAPVMQAEQAGVFRKVFKSVEPSLLNRFKQSEALYTKPVVKKIRDRLALSMVSGDTVDQAVDRVAGVDGVFAGERWRAERIVRTELSYSYHVTQHRAMEEMARTEVPDLKKTMVSTFDDRTGKDSKEQHMQIRAVNEPFIFHLLDKHGARTGKTIEYMAPPNRPNDRAAMMPWRDGWAKFPQPGDVESAPIPPVVLKEAEATQAPPPEEAKPTPSRRGKLGVREASPDELMGVEWGGEPIAATSEVRMDSIRKAYDTGAVHGLRPPIVVVSPKGKMEVEDGRHRILVARERGIPVKVKFVRGSKAMDDPKDE